MSKTVVLGPNISRSIRQTEEKSEVLISLVLVGFLSFIGLLYLVSPKPEDTGILMPVTWVLVLYSPWVILRFILALKKRLNSFLLNFSIVVDVLMLTTLIWSFHIQYDQDPSFYLKAPTFVVYFVFIVLRSLRYDPRYVLFAGVSSAVGWAFLTGWALYFGGETTRSFVEYMTGLGILVGAQVEKVLILLVVTLILYIGAGRSRALLASSEQNRWEANQLTRFFSKDAAEQILTNPELLSPGNGFSRNALSLMIDLRGFTKFATGRDPREVMEDLAEYQSRLVPIILSGGGVVDKFLGDGILVTFGAVNESEHWAADGLRTVEALLEEASRWKEERKNANRFQHTVGMAAAHGDLIFGTVGDSGRLELTVIGNPVNLCVKIEKGNKTLGSRFLCPEETYQLALDQGYRPKRSYSKAKFGSLVEKGKPMVVNYLK